MTPVTPASPDEANRPDLQTARTAASQHDDPAMVEQVEQEPDEPRSFAKSVLAGLRELVIILVLALGLSFVVKTWLFQAFYIPSASMEDTLVKDDRVIVSKLTPGLFDLKRGDIIVFEDPGSPSPWLPPSEPKERGAVGKVLTFVGLLPEDSEDHLIKRVIGLPGDHITADGGTGKLKVNGVEVTEPYIKSGSYPSQGLAFDIVVPQDKVWVMGDNRDNSGDSRRHDDGTGAEGSVAMSKIVGRALFVVWPVDHVTWLGVPDRVFRSVPAGTSTPTPAVAPTPAPGSAG